MPWLVSTTGLVVPSPILGRPFLTTCCSNEKKRLRGERSLLPLHALPFSGMGGLERKISWDICDRIFGFFIIFQFPPRCHVDLLQTQKIEFNLLISIYLSLMQTKIQKPVSDSHFSSEERNHFGHFVRLILRVSHTEGNCRMWKEIENERTNERTNEQRHRWKKSKHKRGVNVCLESTDRIYREWRQ